MIRRTRPADRISGFTLLEVLITLAILAAILTMVFGVLYTTIKARAVIEAEMNRQKIVPGVFKVMEEDFSSAFLPVPDGKFFLGKDSYFGAVSTDRVDFLTARSSWDPETETVADVTEVGYQLAPGEENPEWFRLYRREDPFVDDDPLSGGSLTLLHDKVLSLDIQYYDGTDWLKEWESEKKKELPRAVRVEMHLLLDPDPVSPDAPVKEPKVEILIVPLPR